MKSPENIASTILEYILHQVSRAFPMKQPGLGVIVNHVRDKLCLDMLPLVEKVPCDQPSPVVDGLHLVKEEVSEPVRDEFASIEFYPLCPVRG